MLDDKANEAMEEVLRRGAALIEALKLTPVENEYAMQESQRIMKAITEAYFDDKHLKGRNVRPVAVAATAAFSLTYFDKWVTEIERKFPRLGN